MNFVNNVIWMLIAYLIGSIPTAYLVTKRVRGLDIREHGSNNMGATNVFRVAGKGWGCFVLIADILKGWIVTIVLAPTASAFPELSTVLKQFLFGVAAVSGHAWTPWLKLKGGKGVATSTGVMLGIFPLATFLAALVWGLCFFIKRYVSLASIIAVASFPLLFLFFYRGIEHFWTIFITSAGLAALLVYKHRSNIQRLKEGTEPRVSFGGKASPD